MMFGVLLAVAATTAQPKLHCFRDAVTQADLNVCAIRDAKAADAAMISEYKIATSILG